MDSFIEPALLGFLQGLTEFIPISSSGHLVIAQNFLEGASEHLFLQFVNIGTFLALLVFFRRKILDMIFKIAKGGNSRLLRNIFLTALPAGLIGFFMSDFINSSAFFGSSVVVVFTLFIVGVLMIVLEKLPKAKDIKDGDELSSQKSIYIGFAQAVALIPGVSRSGATIIAGRFAGLKPVSAVEYSFLAALPIMLGVMIKLFIKDGSFMLENIELVIVSNTAAFFAGIFAIGFMLRYLAKHTLAIFGWYRVVLSIGLAVIILIQQV